MWSEGAEKVVGLIGTSSSAPDGPELVMLLGDGHISGGLFVSLNLSRCLWIGGLDKRVVNLPVEGTEMGGSFSIDVGGGV